MNVIYINGFESENHNHYFYTILLNLNFLLSHFFEKKIVVRLVDLRLELFKD